jgi:DnaJ like chaperone protein
MGLWKKLDRLAQGSVFEDLTRGISSRMSACSSSQRDKTQDVSFTIAVIVLGAKLAKADGKVTREEVSAFKEVFDIPENEKKNVARLFDSAKTKSDGFAPYAKQIGKKFADRPEVLKNLMGCLYHIACADGRVTEEELNYLYSVCLYFGLSKEDFEKFGLDALAQTSADPFKSLGVSPEDKAEDIKTRYRKLVKENHPDRLLSEGADEEAFNEANRRLAEINSAYRAIKETKGF